MKKLLLFLILTLSLQTFIKADDIREFEIEGVSIGESLLDHFTKTELKKSIIPNYYSNLPAKFRNIYGYAEFKRFSRFKTYDHVSVDFHENDKQYIVRTISGVLFIDNYYDCKKKQSEIDSSLKQIFKNTHREENSSNHSADITGNSKTKAINYWFNSNDLVTLICTDWSDQINENQGWNDNLSLEIKLKEYNDFLIEAYK